MTAFDHGPSRAPEARESDSRRGSAQQNSRYGLILFSVYLLIYGAFVLTNAFAPQVMDRTPAAGVSLSIFAGFGLIAAAFLLALIYGWLCRAPASRNSRDGEPGT